MEKIQKLKLDFTENGSREEFLSAYCGDMNSNVIELEITPELKENEMLICSFMKDNTPVETLVVENKRLVIPYAVLKEEGSYSASFAVADMHSRLTATATLSVTVAKDSILIAPDKEGADDTSLISYILSASAIAARAAVEEDVNGIAEAVSELTEEVESIDEAVRSMDGDLSVVASDVANMREDVDSLLASSPNTRIIASGTGALTSTASSMNFSNGIINWTRIADTVIARYAFYTYGLSSVTVEGLPFAFANEIIAFPAVHMNYATTGVNLSGDFNIDRAELTKGLTSFTLHREYTSAAAVCGTLIYRTNDPMPQ